jgi:hypothetical protein
MRRQIGLPLAAIAIAIAALASMPCRAGEVKEPRFEAYTGADTDGRTANIASSLVWGVFGPVTQPGFRLKLDSLAGIYEEMDTSVVPSRPLGISQKNVTDVMAGYQFKYGPAWVKFYAGAGYEAQAGTSWRRYNYVYSGTPIQQQGFGVAAAFQSYWRVSDRVWTSLSVTWLQPDSSISIYSRAIYDIYRTKGGLAISAGAEASLSSAGAGIPYNQRTCHNGDGFECYDSSRRAGALLNLRYGANDLTLSAGISQTYGQAGYGPYESTSPYASVSYGRQF